MCIRAGGEAMASYLVLLRGINVGGRNTIPMTGLKTLLVASGFDAVATYLQSGNVMLGSTLGAEAVARMIEARG